MRIINAFKRAKRPLAQSRELGPWNPPSMVWWDNALDKISWLNENGLIAPEEYRNCRNRIRAAYVRKREEEGWTVETEKVFICDYCGQEFKSSEECEDHEKTHYVDYSVRDNRSIASSLYGIEEKIPLYRIGKTVFGMPETNFRNILLEAVKRLMKEDNT